MQIRVLTCSVSLAAALLSAVPSADAQILAPTTEAPQLQLGPLSLYPSVRLLDVGIDENVFNDAENPKQDHTLTLASNVLAAFRFGSNELLAQSGGDYVWFREYTSERYAGGRHAVRMNLSTGRLKPFVGAVHHRTRARRGFEIDTRAGWRDRSALAGLALELTDRTGITASARVDDTIYDRDEQFDGVNLADALNRRGRLYSAAVRYAVTPFTTVLVQGDYAEDEFPLSHVRDARSYSFVPALEFSSEAAIRGRVMAGFQVFQPLDSTLPEYKGSVLSAAVNWSLYGRNVLDIQAVRNVNYSYHPTQPYYLLTGVRTALTRPLFGPVDLHGGAEWEHLSYRWQRHATLDTDLQSDTTRVIFGGVRINLGRGLGMAIMGERTDRRSNQIFRRNYERTRLFTSLTFGA